MSNKRTYIALAALVVTVLLLLYFFGGKGRTYAWREHYRPSSKDPYGTFLVHELLKAYFPGGHFEVMKDSLISPSTDSLGNYVFIGRHFKMDSLKLHRLLDFVEAGNDAFIACAWMPWELLDSISSMECIDLGYLQDSVYYEEEMEYFYLDTMASLNLVHHDLRFDSAYDYAFRVRDEHRPFHWNYLPTELFCEARSNMVSLGEVNGEEVNFAKANYGEGHFYLHTNPIAFTNYFLLEKPGLEYAERVLSHLEARPIYWDGIRSRGSSGSGGGGGRNSFGESPLRYILSQPALKWAWYTLLGMALLYLIFKAKRRQRVIPVLEKNENTSLEFIGTIGRLHFIQGNHRELAKQKMRLFLGYVRERYHLSTKELGGAFQQQLADRSEVSPEVIGKIFTINRNLSSSQYSSENVLIELHRAMAEFYQKCK